MDDSKNQAGNARLLNMPGRRDQMLRTMLLCALTAAIFFLPFYIIDGGFFHYAGDFTGPLTNLPVRQSVPAFFFNF